MEPLLSNLFFESNVRISNTTICRSHKVIPFKVWTHNIQCSKERRDYRLNRHSCSHLRYYQYI